MTEDLLSKANRLYSNINSVSCAINDLDNIQVVIPRIRGDYDIDIYNFLKETMSCTDQYQVIADSVKAKLENKLSELKTEFENL